MRANRRRIQRGRRAERRAAEWALSREATFYRNHVIESFLWWRGLRSFKAWLAHPECRHLTMRLKLIYAADRVELLNRRAHPFLAMLEATA